MYWYLSSHFLICACAPDCLGLGEGGTSPAHDSCFICGDKKGKCCDYTVIVYFCEDKTITW